MSTPDRQAATTVAREPRTIKYVKAISEALTEEMERDERVVLFGIDVGAPGGPFAATKGLYLRFGPERVFDTPISEEGIVGLAVGAAAAGLRPVVEIMFMDFSTLASDQIVNQAAKMHYMLAGKVRLPLVIRTMGGAGLSAGPQHSQSLEAWFAHIPGLKVVMPSTPRDVKGLLKAAIRDDNPVLLIEHKALYRSAGPVPDGDFTVPIGQAEVKRAGRHATVVTYSLMVQRALAAADKLAAEGIEVEVVDLRTLTPLDMETVYTSVRKTMRLLVVHEAVRDFGPGAEVAARVAEECFDSLDAPIMRVGGPYTPVPFSPVLENSWLPNEDRIVATIRQLLA